MVTRDSLWVNHWLVQNSDSLRNYNVILIKESLILCKKWKFLQEWNKRRCVRVIESFVQTMIHSGRNTVLMRKCGWWDALAEQNRQSTQALMYLKCKLLNTIFLFVEINNLFKSNIIRNCAVFACCVFVPNRGHVNWELSVTDGIFF